MYTRIDSQHEREIASIFGDGRTLHTKGDLSNYGHDETEDLQFPPELVVLPETTEEVAALMKYCSEHRIPVTPMGARTGLSGGALAVHGGVGLSMERMNAIVQIDELNSQVHVQPGVITQELQEAVAAKGLYYPPDPASRGTCFIGGNLAENSGGPHAVKYGVTSDYVLNLQVVLPTGKVIWTGANTLKNSTGYNLTQLMVGSEGTLGIITQAVLRLIPLPQHNMLMLVPFKEATKACEAVAAIFRAGIVPSALEFMERDAIDLTMKFTGVTDINLSEDITAHLLIEVDGNHPELLMTECERIMTILEGFGCDSPLFAEDQAAKDKLWFLRRRVGEAVKAFSVYKEEDTVVPRFHLAELLAGVKEIGSRYNFRSVCYGHAGDGNLHVNILKGELDQQVWNNTLPMAIEEIFRLCVRLKGTLSGEHGIGWVQKDYMPIAFSEVELNLMRGLKHLFDPQNILNPSKILPQIDG